MRPTILTDDVLSEIDVQADLDAVDREPTDAPRYGRGFVEQLGDLEAEMAGIKRKWDAWVNLP